MHVRRAKRNRIDHSRAHGSCPRPLFQADLTIECVGLLANLAEVPSIHRQVTERGKKAKESQCGPCS